MWDKNGCITISVSDVCEKNLDTEEKETAKKREKLRWKNKKKSNKKEVQR